jgi:GH15 family glucan-1,4-alpha-glucosidase
MKTILILFSLLVITSCNGQKTNLANSEHESQFTTGEFDLADTTYFVMVKNYIRENGKERKENASSNSSKEFIITYYSIDFEDMEISIDHTDRIYMNMDNQHFGNILKEKGTVVPEIIYGVPDSNPALTKQKEKKVLEIYRSLIARANSK